MLLGFGVTLRRTLSGNFITWWLKDEPRELWKTTLLLTGKIAVFFSLSVLVGTLFAPWKRDIQRTSNLPMDLMFRRFIDNLVSRLVGFVIRSITVFIGLGAMAACFAGGIGTILFWSLAPAIVALIIWLGVIR